jgi:hypothetical protein
MMICSPESQQSDKLSKITKSRLDKEPKTEFKFGIGEWYGRSFADLTGDQRREFAAIQSLQRENRPKQLCPFLSQAEKPVNCHKDGGICSLRSYERSRTTGVVTLDSRRSPLVTTCPSRFEQKGTIYSWVNEIMLPNQTAIPIGEIPFLLPSPKVGHGRKTGRREIGSMDNVLAVPGTDPLIWCPLNLQSVCFLSKKMNFEFDAIAKTTGEGIPFPLKCRRPDYRNSFTKRLLPQLQMMVPSLSRSAKKMAVVIDEEFFGQFAPIKTERHISMAEILWFVVKFVKYEIEAKQFILRPQFVHMTTLEASVASMLHLE